MVSAERLFTRHVVRGVLVYTALIGIAWCWLFPIAWAVSGSLKREGEITEPRLFPAHPRWSNYTEVFSLLPFARMFFNTVLYAGCVTAGRSFLLAGWIRVRPAAISRSRHAVRAIPGHIDGAADRDSDPAVHLDADRRVGRHSVVDDRARLVRQRIRHLPDAAVLPDSSDGPGRGGDTRRLLAVADLLANPVAACPAAVMVLAVLTWVNVWNDFLWPLLMLQRNSLATLTLGLVRLRASMSRAGRSSWRRRC